MTDRRLKIKGLLRLEVAHKSQSAVAFMLFAVFIFFYCYGCVEFAPYIKASMILIIIVSALRIFIVRKIKASGNFSETHWKALVVCIWLNALGWSAALNLASLELKLEGTNFIVVTTMLAGFIAASIVTLSYDVALFVPFQVLLLGPQLGIIVYLYYADNVNALPLIPIYLMYLAYQMKQLKAFRAQVIQSFNNQLDLEQSNENLKMSQTALIDQTVKLIHTSRLAALGEMSAGMAHEVNNPLAIISGSVQHMEKLAMKNEIDQSKLLQISGRTQNAVERITKIVHGLKVFSQQSDAHPKVLSSIKQIVEETENFCNEMLTARQIKLIIDPVPDAYIYCHPVQISQVLINLIKNAEDALEFEKDEKERWIRLSFYCHEEHVAIHVLNGGPTIPQALHDKLFEPFFTTKAIGKGTGLGLSISKGIMREHKGDLVYNANSSHSDFILQLPITCEA